MDKIPYLQKLHQETVGLPADHRSKIMEKYRLYFEVGALDGLSVAEVTAKLPSPSQAIQSYLASNSQSNTPKTAPIVKNTRSFIGKFLVGGFLLFFSLFAFLVPTAVAFGVIAGLGVGGVSILLYGISLMHTAFLPILPTFFSISAVMIAHPIASGILGIGLSALGLLFTLLAIRILQITFRLVRRYFKWAHRALIGGN